jgi:hypothetical protein
MFLPFLSCPLNFFFSCQLTSVQMLLTLESCAPPLNSCALSVAIVFVMLSASMPPLSEDNSLGSNFTKLLRFRLMLSLLMPSPLLSISLFLSLDFFIGNLTWGCGSSLVSVVAVFCFNALKLDGLPPGDNIFVAPLLDAPSCAFTLLWVDRVGMLLGVALPLGDWAAHYYSFAFLFLSSIFLYASLSPSVLIGGYEILINMHPNSACDHLWLC